MVLDIFPYNLATTAPVSLSSESTKAILSVVIVQHNAEPNSFQHAVFQLQNSANNIQKK
jgi:hypothetical protein